VLLDRLKLDGDVPLRAMSRRSMISTCRGKPSLDRRECVDQQTSAVGRTRGAANALGLVLAPVGAKETIIAFKGEVPRTWYRPKAGRDWTVV